MLINAASSTLPKIQVFQSLLWTEALHFGLVTLPNFSFDVSEIPFIKRSITQKAYREAFRFESESYMAMLLVSENGRKSGWACLHQIALVRKEV